MEDTKQLELVESGSVPSSLSKTKDCGRKRTPQYLAALAGTAGAFSLGNVLGWSSGGIPSMVETGDFEDFTAESVNASWVASIYSLGCLTAALTMGFPLDKFGRRWTMLALSIPGLIGWLLMGLATNIPMLLVGRFLTGFYGGSFTFIYPIYTSEIADNDIRGVFGNGMNVILCSGIFFAYVISAALSWKAVSLVCAAVPVLSFFAILLFLPESPHYLVTKGRGTEACSSLKRLRGTVLDSDVETELMMIRKSAEESTVESLSPSDLLAKPILKPTLICMMLMVIQQLGGIIIVLCYAENIFTAAKTNIQPDLQSIIIACFQVTFVIVSTLLVERLGRKFLLTVSDLGMAISLALLGAFFYLQEKEEEMAGKLGWLPLGSLILYTITYNLGVGPLPWTVMGELVPPQAKGLAGALASSVCWGLGFIVGKMFHSMVDTMGTYGVYWFFSAASLAGSVFCLLVVPETRGRSLEEIQDLFRQ